MNNLYITVGYTLIDVSDTGVIDPNDSHQRNQCRNWETLMQVLGMRAQLDILRSPEVMEFDLSTLKFGEDFIGKHLVWTFKFGVEQEGVFAKGSLPYGTLDNDCASVPVIIGLNETVKLLTPTFCISGTQRNIYFEDINF